ncbi:MAG: hypothetical protein EZS28_040236 [Streblomastix strix]|uniref:Poly(A) polymerase RNA-binding domain-containing protein n=1 Tax=Streblomastix strix TaxID=222440 RepID=A0A5J4U114_9EUKA|nr:MAG: hypothetical protein EZS28_040236 [Streblomastix strix]
MIELCQPSTFFQDYECFIQVDFTAYNPDERKKWDGFGESMMRSLAFLIEHQPNVDISHIFPHKFETVKKIPTNQDQQLSQLSQQPNLVHSANQQTTQLFFGQNIDSSLLKKSYQLIFDLPKKEDNQDKQQLKDKEEQKDDQNEKKNKTEMEIDLDVEKHDNENDIKKQSENELETKQVKTSETQTAPQNNIQPDPPAEAEVQMDIDDVDTEDNELTLYCTSFFIAVRPEQQYVKLLADYTQQGKTSTLLMTQRTIDVTLGVKRWVQLLNDKIQDERSENMNMDINCVRKTYTRICFPESKEILPTVTRFSFF